MRAVTYVYRSKLGEDHPFSLVCANNQAAALQRNGETAEALRLARLAASGASPPRARPPALPRGRDERGRLPVRPRGRRRGGHGHARDRRADAVRTGLSAPGLPALPGQPRGDRGGGSRDRRRDGDPSVEEAVDALQERVSDEHPAVRELLAGRVVYRVTDPQEPF